MSFVVTDECKWCCFFRIYFGKRFYQSV